jgi:hypothetical protein
MIVASSKSYNTYIYLSEWALAQTKSLWMYVLTEELLEHWEKYSEFIMSNKQTWIPSASSGQA